MKRIFKIIPVLALVASIWFVAFNHIAIADWWFLRSYEPSEEIQEIASNMKLSEKGKKHFYVSDPQLNGKKEFNENCPSVETTSILGCYTSSRKIYILDVTKKELEGVEDVTAVHEMLHAAYDRLSREEKERIDSLLNDAFAELVNKRLEKIISEYENKGQHVVTNELHSRLATEFMELPPDLDEYYSQYFTDGRKAVVNTFNEYEAVFEDIEQRKKELLVDINNIKPQINNLQSQIDGTRVQLDSVRTEMDEHQNAGRVDEYNALVPVHNNLVGRLRSLVSRHNSLVNTLNVKIREYNSLTFRQQELIEAIDSHETDTPESL